LTAFNQNLLSVRLYTGEGVKLKFEGFAVGRRIEFDIILLALMLNNN
jgi:hypothetical protein